MFFGLGVVVRVCGCCRSNLHAAGGSAAPSSPSPLQVILLILLLLCAEFARCVYSLHPLCATYVVFLSAGRVRQVCVCCVCLCAFEWISQFSTASWGHHAHVCVFFHCVDSQQTSAVLSTGFCFLSWSRTNGNNVAEVAPGQWSTFLSYCLILLCAIHW